MPRLRASCRLSALDPMKDLGVSDGLLHFTLLFVRGLGRREQRVLWGRGVVCSLFCKCRRGKWIGGIPRVLSVAVAQFALSNLHTRVVRSECLYCFNVHYRVH